MKIQELIDRYKSYEGIWDAPGAEAARKCFIRVLEQLEESTPGHADEALGEFEQDFSYAKWREGYEQGKLEGMAERDKVIIPQFVADWIDACKENSAIGLYIAMNPDFLKQWNKSDELISWSRKTSNQELFARAWLDGYEVDKEPKYKVKFKGVLKNNNYLNYNSEIKNWYHASSLEIGMVRTKFTRKELEDAGFGWVFDCPGIQIEEVEE